MIFLFILLALGNGAFASASDLNFLSGVADTTQYFTIQQQGGTSSDAARIIKRHHLICLHKGPFNQYSNVYNSSPEKCCNDLWLKGLIQTQHKQYCMHHMASLPDLQSPAASTASLVEGVRFARRDVRPMHYLVIDEELSQNETVVSSPNYMQVRQIMARDVHNERESVRDLPTHGIASYSPFHLVDFMPGGRDAVEYSRAINGDGNMVSLMNGKVNGTLSSDGGMHRAFQQRVTLSFKEMKAAQSDEPIKYQMDINATIILPLMETIFIDADDPFIVEYEAGLVDPIVCRSVIHINSSPLFKSKCSIDFISSETIDIEQPSFASRQYVVAYQINASIEFSSIVSSDLEQMQIGFDYGTTIHTRYQLPLFNDNISNTFSGLNGMVPVALHQPFLYSATAQLMEKEGGSTLKYFVLDTSASTESRYSEESRIPEPILIAVAAGLDDDYWWVTSITMLSALIGGFVVMRSIDSVSTWT
jgi:hypothetical protein